MNNRWFRRAAHATALTLAAATLLPLHASAAPARISLADLGTMITKSLEGVRSFQVVIDSTSGATSRQRITMDLVRRGAGFVGYSETTVNGQTMTMVDTGKHMCVRRSAGSAWNCQYPTSLATELSLYDRYRQSFSVLWAQ